MDSPFSEITTTTLEWKIPGLKKIFESSKGETKSKVTRSIQFGGGKWQILFYPNSGTDGGTHVSLYLSCEPTTEEKERAVNGKWTRDGLFKFSFELRNVAKSVLFNSKEACDHSFSYKTANWGWAQFARRDMVYYQANSVKQADAFTIICVISSSPYTPSPPPMLPLQAVPCELMDSIGDLLNDPLYSDVEFVLSSPASGGKTKKIYAMKRLLVRTDYFDIMLNTGFAESDDNRSSIRPSLMPLADAETTSFFPPPDIDDSDYEEDGSGVGSDCESDSDSELDDRATISTPQRQTTPSIQTAEDGDTDKEGSKTSTNTGHEEEERENAELIPESSTSVIAASREPSADALSMSGWTLAGNDVDGSSSTSLSPPVPEKEKEKEEQEQGIQISVESEPSPGGKRNVPAPGPPKVRVVVRDVAYRTYYAMLHYLYTDSITFAPLTSTFSHPKTVSTTSSPATGANTPLQTPALVAPASAKIGESSSSLHVPSSKQNETPPVGPTSRKEWLKEWRATHEDEVVEPCSAKAMYKLADKLDLLDLKTRAFKHILKSMTTQNVPHEMFSSFSAKFDEVRKVQIEYFLAHWSEIRGSEGMKSIWTQIRVGRHPGFEEVWPLIAMNLEFKPSTHTEDGDDEHDGVRDS